MEFNDNKAIYLQIVEYVCEQILLDKWKPEEKILSVRELAVTMEVNPNTVMRSYDILQNEGIIHNKRGIGFFLDEDATKKVKAYRRKNFMQEEMPILFRTMYLLNIDFNELKTRYETFVAQNFNSNNDENK